MTALALRLNEDRTGSNPNNKITNEPYTLSNKQVRSIAPINGPFFGNSLVIMDGARLLVRGVDYQLVELHQEATLLTGKEIYSVILIINKDVSSSGSVTYQALGGHYQYNDAPIANLFQTVLNDNRPVDWTNIFNKPTEFNPTIHRHLLDDVYGFEPVVDYLERIKRAITLGQTSIVLEIVNSLLSKFKCKELPLALPSNKLIQYDALLFFLSRRKILNNIWVDKKHCKWVKGQNGIIEVDTSGYPVGTQLYWQFYKQNDERVTLFSNKDGWITGNGGIVEINIYIPSDLQIIENNLYLGIKEHPDDVDFKAVTYVIEITEPATTTSMYGYLLNNPSEGTDFDFAVSYTDSVEEYRLYATMTNY